MITVYVMAIRFIKTSNMTNTLEIDDFNRVTQMVLIVIANVEII